MDSDTSRSLSSSEVSSVSTPTASGAKSSAARRKKKRSSVTVPKPFNLSLDHRVGERMRYDSSQRQRQEEQEKVWRERREKEEEEARKEMRKKVGFKANPVRVFKPMTAAPSSKPLTVPEPPTLLTALLSEQRKTGCRDTRASSTGSSRENSTSPLNPYTETDGVGRKRTRRKRLHQGEGQQEVEVEDYNDGEEEEELEEEEEEEERGEVLSRRKLQPLVVVCDVSALVVYYVVVYATLYFLWS